MNQEKISKLEQIINSDYSNLAGIVVRKNGETLYEGYFHGYSADDAVHVFSVTKSIFSVLIGIAIDKGYIQSTEQKVLDFFPDYTVKRGEKTLQNVRIKDMLTMTVPYKYKSAPYTKYFTSESWVKTALDLMGGRGKIGEFRYAPLVGPDVLSGIISNATGQSALAFATKYLFSPLGIKEMHNIVFHSKEEQIAWSTKDARTPGWVADPQGINTVGWGLTLTPSDMGKIGQLYLNGGIWDGKHIVSSEWVAESTREHSRCVQWGNLGYGYLWWIPNENSYAAMGDGGNVIYVDTKKKMVVSIASLFKPNAKDRIELITEQIEPIFED